MSSMICTCGMLKIRKVGVTVTDGVEHCNNCRLPLHLDLQDPTIVAARSRGVDASMMSTLAEIPGYRVVRHLGVVTELSASAGFTARSKGNEALSVAMRNLGETASRMRANAVLGLTSSPFGAGGGITSAFGGDAVGVLLLGTAVVVEPIEGVPAGG